MLRTSLCGTRPPLAPLTNGKRGAHRRLFTKARGMGSTRPVASGCVRREEIVAFSTTWRKARPLRERGCIPTGPVARSGDSRSSSVVERTLGKGEVGSSILPCGTSQPRNRSPFSLSARAAGPADTRHSRMGAGPWGTAPQRARRRGNSGRRGDPSAGPCGRWPGAEPAFRCGGRLSGGGRVARATGPARTGSGRGVSSIAYDGPVTRPWAAWFAARSRGRGAEGVRRRPVRGRAGGALRDDVVEADGADERREDGKGPSVAAGSRGQRSLAAAGRHPFTLPMSRSCPASRRWWRPRRPARRRARARRSVRRACSCRRCVTATTVRAAGPRRGGPARKAASARAGPASSAGMVAAGEAKARRGAGGPACRSVTSSHVTGGRRGAGRQDVGHRSDARERRRGHGRRLHHRRALSGRVRRHPCQRSRDPPRCARTRSRGCAAASARSVGVSPQASRYPAATDRSP